MGIRAGRAVLGEEAHCRLRPSDSWKMDEEMLHPHPSDVQGRAGGLP